MSDSISDSTPVKSSEASTTAEPGHHVGVDIGWARQDYENVEKERQAVRTRGAARVVEVLRAYLDRVEQALGAIKSDSFLENEVYVVGDKFSASHLQQAMRELRAPEQRAWIAFLAYYPFDAKRGMRLDEAGDAHIDTLRSMRVQCAILRDLHIDEGCRIDRDPVVKLAQGQAELRGLLKELAHKAISDELRMYVSADSLELAHGIRRSRLSEAARIGKVRTKKAPAGYPTTDGSIVRILYHAGDARKHCSPQQTKKRQRQAR